MKHLVILIGAAALAATPEQIAFFEKNVRPVLVNSCYACHSADTKPAGNLRVDDYNGILRGGDGGAAVVPGNPAKSLLLQRVAHADARRRMPKEGAALTETQIAHLRTWIAEGAAWPVEKVEIDLTKTNAGYERMKAKHWSLQPVATPAIPAVQNTRWPQGPIDRFLLSKLEAKQLHPVADADRLTLVRRVTYDLTGLPPTPAEADAFTKDKSPLAYEALVDRLLTSPRFGERWGRHWLDVARYAESSGPSRNIPYPHAWRYRDYVLDAVNRDVPFNRFLQEQIAGDLLPAATTEERDRLLIATGFLAIGPKDVNQRFKERFVMDNAAEQVDTLTRSTLALTVGCARCHDHKFDPIPTADYYALTGIFTSTDDAAGVRSKMGGAGYDYYVPDMLVRLASYKPAAADEKVKDLELQVSVAKKNWDAIRGTPEGLSLGPNGRPKQQPFRLAYEKVQAELLQLTDPASHGYAVHGLRDAKVIADTAIRIRGEAERMGPVVPRGFLSAVQVPGAAPLNPKQSGRLELAQWIASDRNPLTARVMVNRVWQHLYGQGLVKTVDNFGMTGDRPSHPELLDYLADEFIRDGWSVKRLVRRILLTRSYRLSGDAPAAYKEADPENRLVWRHSPRRLDAEEIRDSLLATSGRLNLQAPVGSPAQELKMVEIRDNGVESRVIHEKADQSVLRSIYLPLLRGLTPHALEAFDPVTQTLVTGQRDTTTVPTQALFLLNSAFVRRESQALAGQLTAGRQTERERIREAYRRVLNREPSAVEFDRVSTFLAGVRAGYRPATQTEAAVTSIALKLPAAGQPPADPDNVDRTDFIALDSVAPPADADGAAWASFAQALYATAEFRFVR
ncbi:MAG TPA: PSD1 and planctomycete cytochrome C domain-containing protein [Bryobacteraceae bacterium]|nr:PSD1 and planctomycete cytochrome C domain-containing protein [Bryobacteraceae bacterium]